MLKEKQLNHPRTYTKSVRYGEGGSPLILGNWEEKKKRSVSKIS